MKNAILTEAEVIVHVTQLFRSVKQIFAGKFKNELYIFIEINHSFNRKKERKLIILNLD